MVTHQIQLAYNVKYTYKESERATDRPTKRTSVWCCCVFSFYFEIVCRTPSHIYLCYLCTQCTLYNRHTIYTYEEKYKNKIHTKQNVKHANHTLLIGIVCLLGCYTSSGWFVLYRWIVGLFMVSVLSHCENATPCKCTHANIQIKIQWKRYRKQNQKRILTNTIASCCWRLICSAVVLCCAENGNCLNSMRFRMYECVDDGDMHVNCQRENSNNHTGAHHFLSDVLMIFFLLLVICSGVSIEIILQILFGFTWE